MTFSMSILVAACQDGNDSCAHIFALGLDKRASLIHEGSSNRAVQEGPEISETIPERLQCMVCHVLRQQLSRQRLKTWLWNSGDFPHSNGIEKV
jgi:hypothetical protein